MLPSVPALETMATGCVHLGLHDVCLCVQLDKENLLVCCDKENCQYCQINFPHSSKPLCYILASFEAVPGTFDGRKWIVVPASLWSVVWAVASWSAVYLSHWSPPGHWRLVPVC